MPGQHASERKRRSLWPWLVPLAALLAGVLFSSSIRASQGADLRSTVTGLPDLIREGANRNRTVAQQVDALRAEVEALTRAAAPGSDAVKELKARGDAIALAAGRVPVKGPAVRVTLRDSTLDPGNLPPGRSLDDIIVHQQDVQAVVNALWLGGAEAMLLQDQRVISTSAVRCVGNTLILQGRVYSPPYVITAIGDQDALTAALDRDPVIAIYQEYVQAVGLGYEVARVGGASFPAYSGSIVPAHARVPL